MSILSIQSHVAYGHVGNRSAVFPLERMGFDVWPINTVQFSSNTGRPGWKGRVFPGQDIRDVVAGVEALGVLGECGAVLSGYMGDVSIGAAILDAVDRVKRANPEALYCCDPVMGDAPGGLYVRSDIPGFIAGEAVPRADIICPNHFEAETLTGTTLATDDDAARAADALHEKGPSIVLITSHRRLGEEETGFFLSDGASRRILRTPVIRFARQPKGSGDLASALFLGYYLKSRDAVSALEAMASALYAVFEATASVGADEMAIVQAQAAIEKPPLRFKALEGRLP